MSGLQVEAINTKVCVADPERDFGVSYGQNRYTGEIHLDTVDLQIRNARLAPEEDVATRGFTLMKHETKVTDFRDRAQVDAIYDQEGHDLIKEMTGAKKVIVFHNQLRDNSSTAGKDISRSEEHTSELQSLMRISYADFWLKNKKRMT